MKNSKGFGFLELLIALVIMLSLMTVAIPMYDNYADRARTSKAIGDIASIAVSIETFRLNNRDRVPSNLNELPNPAPTDPWGNDYVFLNIIDDQPNIGDLRKDGKLNPLNTDYDLYSRGEDGDSVGSLNAKASRDDIVRASDGAFIGLGEDY